MITPSAGPGIDSSEFLRRVVGLNDLLDTSAAEAEELRRLPDTTMEAATKAELFSALVPTSLGGHGLGLDAIAQATRTMGQACPASAWTLSFLILHGWLLAKLPADGRAEVFENTASPLAAAPLAPTGTVKPCDGGYRLSGRWEWATGVAHSDWVLVHAIATEPTFSTLFCAAPLAEIEVDDVWFTSGMRATGSNTVLIDEVFVPSHRSIDARTMMYGAEPVDGDGLIHHPVPSVLALVAAAPALGAAEAAVAHYRQRLESRVLAYTLGDKAREQPAAQVRLATAMSDLTSARVRWDQAIADLTGACADGPPSEETRVATRLAAAATVRASKAVITTVCDGAGASVYQSSVPLQRLQRDVEVLKGHVMFDWDRTAELAGRFALGFELQMTDLV